MLRRHLLALPLAALARGQSALPDFYRNVRRVTWVVDDAAAVGAAWARIGVPVLRTIDSIELDGHPLKAVTGHLGQTRIDWIQPLSEDGYFARYLETHRGPGIFGLVYNAPSMESFEAEAARLSAAGAKVLSRGMVGNETVASHYCYFSTLSQGLYNLCITFEPEPALPPAPKERSITQYALITREPEKVSAFWASLGFPAFSYTVPETSELVYRDKPGSFAMRLGWQRHGSVPFEWIEPRKGPSSYHEHLDKYGEGFHHIAFNVADMDGAIAEWKQLGYLVSMGGAWGEKDKPGSGRFTYFDTRKEGGVEVELLWNYRAG